MCSITARRIVDVMMRATSIAVARATSREMRFIRPSSSSSSRAFGRHARQRAHSTTSSSRSREWEFKLLYDGACPLCVREVEFLRAKDAGRGKLLLVDLASETYDEREHNGIDYERGMRTIHGVTASGDVITGVETFERAYAAVGIGYIYAFTKIPVLLRAANAVYDVWAKYRLNVTARGSLAEHLQARAAREAGKTCAVADAECATK